MHNLIRSRWAAVGAAVAVTLGAGGISLTQAAISTGDMPVFVTLDAPCRLVDTRPATQVGVKNTPIAAGEANAYEIQVTGGSGNCTGPLAIPADATAVALNVTAIAPNAPSGRSFFTVYPADAPLPGTSNLNFVTGQPPVPNKVDVGLSAAGKIRIFNFDGTSHAAVDVFGYYVDHEHTGADIVDESITGADIDNGTVSNSDTSNEPGIAYAFEPDVVSPTATPSAMVSTSIRVPSDGYIVVQATGSVRGNGASDEAWCQFQKGTVGAISFAEPAFEVDDRNAPENDWDVFSAHTVLEIDSADNPLSFFSGQGIHLVCDLIAGDVDFDNLQISATFYATSYAPLGFIFPF